MIVTVTKTFSDFGHRGTAGERIDVTPVVASVLARRGYITVSDGAYRTASMATAQPSTDPDQPKRRRNYRRRDMVADGAE